MFRYIGGKYFTSDWIIKHFCDHFCYVEVFGGAGWVLINKPISKVEVYNDLNEDVYNVFYCLKYKRQELMRYLKNTVRSRKFYEYYKNKFIKRDFIDDVERAYIFVYLACNSFSGTLLGGFSTGVRGKQAGVLSFLKKVIKLRDRFKNVTLECLDFEEVIKRYDSKETLFYVDPPYLDTEHYYSFGNVKFTIDDHFRLANVLKNIKGKFLLSYYDHPFVDENYKGFNIDRKEVVKLSCGITRNRKDETKPRGVELLIYNYDLVNYEVEGKNAGEKYEFKLF